MVSPNTVTPAPITPPPGDADKIPLDYYLQRRLEKIGVPAEGVEVWTERVDNLPRRRDPWYEDPTGPDQRPYTRVGRIAQGRLVTVGGYSEAGPEHVDKYLTFGDIGDELALSIGVDAIDRAFNDPALNKITEELDPDHELDPDGSMLLHCVSQDLWFRTLYKGVKEYPSDYAETLYATSLRYVRTGLNGLDELLRLNEDAGVNLEKVIVLWDQDWSQVMVSDPPAPPGHDNDHATAEEEPLTQAHVPKLRHIPSPGWTCLERRMQEKLARLKIGMANGVSSDRPLIDDDHPYEQSVEDPSREGLLQTASRSFRSAGIKLDPKLVLSSKNGSAVERLDKKLRQRRAPNKIGPDGKTVYPTEDEEKQFRREQLALIRNVVPPAIVEASSDIEYHAKLGMIAEIEKRLPEGVAILTLDDLNSVLLLHSHRALGVYIDPDTRPPAPDDGEMPEFFGRFSL